MDCIYCLNFTNNITPIIEILENTEKCKETEKKNPSSGQQSYHFHFLVALYIVLLQSLHYSNILTQSPFISRVFSWVIKQLALLKCLRSISFCSNAICPGFYNSKRKSYSLLQNTSYINAQKRKVDTEKKGKSNVRISNRERISENRLIRGKDNRAKSHY